MRHITTLPASMAAGAVVVAGLLATGCSSNSTTSAPAATNTPAAGASTSTPVPGSGQTQLMTGHTSLGTTLEDSKGFVVYWFAKDHGMTSACTGPCASAWPPVTGTPMAASGVTLPGKLGTISRSGGVSQATYNGHPLYTFAGDSGPGQAHGNGVNGFGGLWYAITIGGAAGTPSSSTSSGSGGGYGY
jgi:predicted lipoprotein with Yx(FWY)xxD motif